AARTLHGRYCPTPQVAPLRQRPVACRAPRGRHRAALPRLRAQGAPVAPGSGKAPETVHQSRRTRAGHGRNPDHASGM
ncbi:MAG: hypothetical protein AVDCRST_MAG18-3195, partial [uncultured Thermomicrobiales bacterium]